MNRISGLLILILSVVALSGCRHKGFCEGHPHGDIYIEVEYDDDNDPDDIVYLRDKVKATRLLAYHEPTSQMVLASDIARLTNNLYLTSDTYHFIAYNAGTQSITFRNSDLFHAHESVTRECDILDPLYSARAVSSDIDLGNGEPVVIAGEPLWSVGAEALTVERGDTVRLTALPLHCRYTFEMRNIKGIEGASRISSFITGMSSGAMLGSMELHDTPVTVAVGASLSADRKSVVGSFICFGHNPRIAARHRMGLFVEMESGEKFKLIEGQHFDVTDQVVAAPNRRRVHIVIDGIELPATNTDAGFDVTVGPWGDGENLDIGIDF